MSRALLSNLVIALEIRHDGGMTAATGARARVRAELTQEILAAARRQLAEQGSAALSLRAVAREVGMVSSAVYRYFPSRDDLLTALIVDAYDGLGAAVERAVAKVPADDLAGRWLADLRPGAHVGAREPARVRADLRQPGARLPRAGDHDRPGDARGARAHPAPARRAGRRRARAGHARRAAVDAAPRRPRPPRRRRSPTCPRPSWCGRWSRVERGRSGS